MTEQKQSKDVTNLSEMAEFFGDAPKREKVVTRAVPMQPGETLEEAQQRQQERTARITAQINKQRKF